MTWTATQDASGVSGPATLLTSPAVTDITISGILSASLAGSQFSLTFTSLAGGVRGSAACSVSGTGSGTVANSTISGSLHILFVSCEALGLQPPANDQLSLTKQ